MAVRRAVRLLPRHPSGRLSARVPSVVPRRPLSVRQSMRVVPVTATRAPQARVKGDGAAVSEAEETVGIAHVGQAPNERARRPPRPGVALKEDETVSHVVVAGGDQKGVDDGSIHASFFRGDDRRSPFAVDVLDLRAVASSRVLAAGNRDVAQTFLDASGRVHDDGDLDVHDRSRYPLVLNAETVPTCKWPRVYRQLHIPGSNDAIIEAFMGESAGEAPGGGVDLEEEFEAQLSELRAELAAGADGGQAGGAPNLDDLRALPPIAAAGSPTHIPVEALPSSAPPGAASSTAFGPELCLIGRSSATKMEERWNVGVYRYRWGLAGSMMAATGVASAAQPWGIIYLSRSWTDEVVFAVEVHSARLADVPGEVLPLAPQARALMEVRVANIFCNSALFKSVELDFAPWSNHFRMQLADWVVKRVVFDDVVPLPLPHGAWAGEAADATALQATEDWVVSVAGSQGEFATSEDTLGAKELFKPFEARSKSDVEIAWPVWSLIEGQPMCLR